MITAAKLKEYDPRSGNKMRTYISSKRNRFIAGSGGIPSQIRIIQDPVEIEELRGIKQFEVVEFSSNEELEKFLQRDMESRVRRGGLNVKADVVTAPAPSGQRSRDGQKAVYADDYPVQEVVDIVTPMPLQAIVTNDEDDEDEPGGHGDTESTQHAPVTRRRGRKPKSEY